MTRRTHEWYPTESWATETLIKLVPVRGVIVEPCVGNGAISNLLKPLGTVLTNDLDHNWPADRHEDARDPQYWKVVKRLTGGVDWVVTNPPFSLAPEILPMAFEYAESVAMLLRISYLEPRPNRALWLAEHPLKQYIVLPRISFTGDGKTDMVTCAWMIWSKRDDISSKIVVVPPRDAYQIPQLDLPAFEHRDAQ